MAFQWLQALAASWSQPSARGRCKTRIMNRFHPMENGCESLVCSFHRRRHLGQQYHSKQANSVSHWCPRTIIVCQPVVVGLELMQMYMPMVTDCVCNGVKYLHRQARYNPCASPYQVGTLNLGLARLLYHRKWTDAAFHWCPKMRST